MSRLFLYGSLQPGQPNAHILDPIDGRWQPATVKGRLIEAGWAANLGHLGLVLDECGDDVRGMLFSAPELPAHWASLDEFEGGEYRRTLATVILADGQRVEAYLYVIEAP